MGILFRSIKIIFTGIKIGISEKALCLNAIKTTMALNWYVAFSAAACGWIGMLRNLEDASAVAPNLSVSLIPFLYACCFNLFLLFVEIRITKTAEKRGIRCCKTRRWFLFQNYSRNRKKISF